MPEHPTCVIMYYMNIEQFSIADRPSLVTLQKGGVPAAPSGTATLLRLSPSYRFNPNELLNGHPLQVPPTSMA